LFMSTAAGPWDELFAGQGSVTAVKAFAVHRRGRPFLLLPATRGAAGAVLSLYPAQSLPARAAKTVLKCLLCARMSWGSQPLEVKVATESAFVRFLRSLSPTREVPLFGVLAGNGANDRQRFLILLFDRERRPVAVVKAGLTAAAQQLVSQEEQFLVGVNARAEAIPPLRDSFQGTHVRAIALDYFAGNSPPATWDHERLATVLSSWIDRQRQLTLGETAAWSRLAAAAQAENSGAAKLAGLVGTLAAKQIPAVIQHGDLAPWNIKVAADGSWTVLDWERGERKGVPAWDWIHYALQPAILVKRRSVTSLIELIEGLLSAQPFRNYTAQTNIQGCERDMVLVYLAWMAAVIRPAEGNVTIQELLRALKERWKSASY
jgi:hypothetical protein